LDIVEVTRDTDRMALRLGSCSKSFGTLRVLDSLDLDVPAGQRLAIIGPSGSGKTTLLRIIMTLERIDQGSIEVFGRTLVSMDSSRAPNGRGMREIRGQIGMVFQHFNLFPHMTALGNVMEAPVQVLGVDRDEARRRALSLLTTVDLADKADAFPRQLSGGQQQRVAIARALAMQPRIMLFDEITSALDPELIGEVLHVVRRLAHDSGMTMLIVTHEMSFARDVSDRVLVMDHGRIIEDGPPANVLVNPSNERTRAFLRAILER
jgi:polar amino acid transport system ATP-binding protein